MNKVVQAVVYTAAVLFTFIVFIITKDISTSTLVVKYAGLVSTIILVGSLVYQYFLWKTNVFQKIPIVPRNISGTWKVTLKYDSNSKEKDIYADVRQNAFGVIRIFMFTNESNSFSTTVNLFLDKETWKMSWNYKNEVKQGFKKGSPDHRGASAVDIIEENDGVRLIGDYWTDRKSIGSLEFIERKKKNSNDFKSAENLFS